LGRRNLLDERRQFSQDRPNVSQFIKQGDGFWLHREFGFLGEVIKLAAFDCELPLKEIYRNVKSIIK
jgi:hypothetical protein